MKCIKCGQGEAIAETEYCPRCEEAFREDEKRYALADLRRLQEWLNQQADGADYCGDALARIREIKDTYGV